MTLVPISVALDAANDNAEVNQRTEWRSLRTKRSVAPLPEINRLCKCTRLRLKAGFTSISVRTGAD